MSTSSSCSSMGGSLALAAVAVSGSLAIFSLCRAHMSGAAPTGPALRPCLSSSGACVSADRPLIWFCGTRAFPRSRMGILTFSKWRLSRRRWAEARGEDVSAAAEIREAGAVRGRRRGQWGRPAPDPGGQLQGRGGGAGYAGQPGGALPRLAPRPLCAQGHVLLLTHASGDRPLSVNSCWAWFVLLVRCVLAVGGLLPFPGSSSVPWRWVDGWLFVK
jgi:hypothetical protein